MAVSSVSHSLVALLRLVKVTFQHIQQAFMKVGI